MTALSVLTSTGATQSVQIFVPGTAGTPSPDVQTIQGAPSMIAVKTDGSAVTQPVSGTFWQTTQPVSIASTVAISAASLPLPTGAATSAKQPAFGVAGTASADVLSIQGIAGATAVKVDGSGVTQPVSGTFWQATQPVSIASTVPVNNAQVNGNTIATGSGTANTGTQRVVIASDQSAFPVTTSFGPAATGGLTTFRSISLTSGVNVKASAGQVYSYYIFNAATSIRYVKFYNSASAPTAGTGTPLMTIPVPAGSAVVYSTDMGIAFSSGIGLTCVTGLADNNTTVATANELIINLNYA